MPIFKSMGLGALALAACFGQGIQVTQSSNAADETKWVDLNIPSITSYLKADGSGKFTPLFTVRCEAKGQPHKEEWSLGVLLDTGGVAPGVMSTRSQGAVTLTAPKEDPALFGRETVLLPLKFDRKEQKRTWELIPKSTAIYQYMGAGETVIGSILSSNQLVEKLFSTNLFSVDFQPFGQSDVFEAKFVTGGLKKEFQQHHECSLK
ncbi:MAG TPA: hypothetical protein VMU19_13880 [Bryobacteraceae bacterium]|nr:hypothetical protein [Bryobacteraceae bacterium]